MNHFPKIKITIASEYILIVSFNTMCHGKFSDEDHNKNNKDTAKLQVYVSKQG